MLKLNRIFAFLALFLGFYLNSISINIAASSHHSQKENHTNLFQQKKANNNNIPSLFVEPFDEKEIDEDEDIKVNHSFFVQEKTTLFSTLHILFEKEFSLPYLFQQNYAFKAPRIILYHSWKYFHS